MSKAYRNFSTKRTPQSEPVPGKNMVKNNAGGYVFEVDKWTRLNRFLILGSEGGTYYVGERELTVENATNVMDCIKEDGIRTVDTIVGISDSGRAPKNDPALFALALAISHGDEKTRQRAAEVLPRVARIGTHLFHFAEYANNMRGWGRVLKGAVANWYQNMDAERLAYQVVKYKGRDGWTHADLLRLSHPKPQDMRHKGVYQYVTKGEVEYEVDLPSVIIASEAVKNADRKTALRYISEYRLPRETVPTELLNEPEIWEALLENMPMTAMLRNMNKMTALGVLTQLSEGTKKVCAELGNAERIAHSRLHPINILVAMRTYAKGRGERGSLTWQPVQRIVDALDAAFYTAFGNIVPFGGNVQLAVDASGSMTGASVSGLPITVLEGAAVMALATAKTEPNHVITAYDMESSGNSYWGRGRGIWPLEISPKMRLDSVVQYLRNNLKGGGTDSSLPFKWAKQQKETFDAICIYSDNETWGGNIHPTQALAEYRRERNANTKLVGVDMTPSMYRAYEGDDPNTLSVVGFDSAAPQLISEFLRGEI